MGASRTTRAREPGDSVHSLRMSRARNSHQRAVEHHFSGRSASPVESEPPAPGEADGAPYDDPSLLGGGTRAITLKSELLPARWGR